MDFENKESGIAKYAEKAEKARKVWTDAGYKYGYVLPDGRIGFSRKHNLENDKFFYLDSKYGLERIIESIAAGHKYDFTKE